MFAHILSAGCCGKDKKIDQTTNTMTMVNKWVDTAYKGWFYYNSENEQETTKSLIKFLEETKKLTKQSDKSADCVALAGNYQKNVKISSKLITPYSKLLNAYTAQDGTKLYQIPYLYSPEEFQVNDNELG